MTKHPIYVTIEIKPYLVDYFKNYYGGHPIKANMESKLLPILHEHLSRTPVKFRPIKQSNKTITFELPYNLIIDIRKLNYIAPRRFRPLNSYFYHKFCYHFISYMNQECFENHISYKAAIIHFMEENNISHDRFQYDSLKRLYLRYRQSFKGKKDHFL